MSDFPISHSDHELLALQVIEQAGSAGEERPDTSADAEKGAPVSGGVSTDTVNAAGGAAARAAVRGDANGMTRPAGTAAAADMARSATTGATTGATAGAAADTAHPAEANRANTASNAAEDRAVRISAPPHASGKTTSVSHLNQRDIARALNMSLGMTNMILRRLAAKGWLTMHRINGRNLAYAVTPEGTREIARRSYRYLRRTIGSVVRWKEAIDAAVREAKNSGCGRVVLAGDSDLSFIVEHACMRHGIEFQHNPAIDVGVSVEDGDFVIVGENTDEMQAVGKDSDSRPRDRHRVDMRDFLYGYSHG